MSTKASAANLVQALKELTLHWEQTKCYWHDVKSAEFERKHLDHLPEQITRAVSVMQEIDLLLKKVKDDCE